MLDPRAIRLAQHSTFEPQACPSFNYIGGPNGQAKQILSLKCPSLEKNSRAM